VEGTHQLFGAEGHKIEVDRPVPGLANTIRILLGIYALFTVLIVLGLYALGMPFFDSVCTAFPPGSPISSVRLSCSATRSLWDTVFLVTNSQFINKGADFLTRSK
jgi:hypothetical protein